MYILKTTLDNIHNDLKTLEPIFDRTEYLKICTQVLDFKNKWLFRYVSNQERLEQIMTIPIFNCPDIPEKYRNWLILSGVHIKYFDPIKGYDHV